MSVLPQTFPLFCHPASSPDGVRGVRVTLARNGAGLALAYRLDADPAALRIPAPGAELPRERLWAHTCFELFVAGEGTEAYREFNFSTSGQWMRFDFGAYRSPISVPAGPAPRLSQTRTAEGLEMAVELEPGLLPAGDLHLGLTAVVEHADGHHSYWALRHPADRPDFHHREGFAFALKAPQP